METAHTPLHVQGAEAFRISRCIPPLGHKTQNGRCASQYETPHFGQTRAGSAQSGNQLKLGAQRNPHAGRLTCMTIPPPKVQHSPATETALPSRVSFFRQGCLENPPVVFQGQIRRPHFFFPFPPYLPLPRTSAQISIKTRPLPLQKNSILSPPSATQSDNHLSSSTHANICLYQSTHHPPAQTPATFTHHNAFPRRP